MHRGGITAAVLLALVVGTGLTSQVASARDPVGQVKRLQSKAVAIYHKQTRELAPAADILFRDLLQTGRGARLKAELVDGTAITLGENAEILIDEFVYDPRQRQGGLNLKVIKGAFLFVGGKVEEMTDSKTRIETPVAILGIRGTTVWGGPIYGGYGVLVLDGEVKVQSPGGAVTLHKGQATMIYDPEEGPEPPRPWSKFKTSVAVKTISFETD